METGRQGEEEIPGKGNLPSLSIPVGIVAAITLGWIAAKLNLAGFAPIGLLPLAIGIALGAVVFWSTSATGIVRRKRLVLATVILAILIVFAEHAWLYRDFCRQWREARANQPQVAMFRREVPWSPLEYFTSEAALGRVALWCVDAALVVVAAVATVIVCQRWTINRITSPTPDP